MINQILIQANYTREHEVRYNHSYKEDEKTATLRRTVTLDLEKFILEGAYTQRKNKEYILKNWLSMSPTDIADNLGIQAQSVRAIQRQIYQDFSKELGNNILDLLIDNNFQQIKKNLDCAYQRLQNNNQFIFKEVEHIIVGKENNLSFLNDKINEYCTTLRIELRENGNIDNSSFHKEAQILKLYTNASLNRLLDNLDIVKFNTLIQILNGNTGSLKLRNYVQKYFD
ncbi:MAG: hypothetical protein ACTJHC_09300 [Vagococcus sp.]